MPALVGATALLGLTAASEAAWAVDPTATQTVSVDFEGAPRLSAATAAETVTVNVYDTTNHYWKGSTTGRKLNIAGVAAKSGAVASGGNQVLVSMENCNNTFTTCTAPLTTTTVTTKNALCTSGAVFSGTPVSFDGTSKTLITFTDGGSFSCDYDVEATLAITDSVDHYVKVTFTIQ